MRPNPETAWQVGVLFSRSGVTAVTETEHLRGTLLAIEEINASGGVLGRPLKPVIYDPAAEDATYRAMARRLLTEDEITVIFGASMSASRKAILPILERNNGLLLYPSIYEGFEYSENVLYGGATLNQNTVALADFLIAEYGRKLLFLGSDYIYPRESNRVMRDLIEARGGEVMTERYLPLDAPPDALDTALSEILHLQPDAVFSTLVGAPARHFYSLYGRSGIDLKRHPIASLTMAETEIGMIGSALCAGHVLAANYVQSLKGPVNERFVAAYKASFGAEAMTSVWSEPAYNQVHLVAQALARTGSLDPARLAQAVLQEEFDAPEGRVGFDPDTRHIWATPRIGIQRGDGQFDIAWEAAAPVRPDPYLATTRFEDRRTGA